MTRVAVRRGCEAASFAAWAILLSVASLSAQSTPSATRPTSGRLESRVSSDEFADLLFSNRRIITFRAIIAPRSPAERAEGARRALTRLADVGITGPVASRPLLDGAVVMVNGRDVFAIVADDTETGEDVAQLTAAAIARLRVALAEAAELRTPRRLAWALAVSVGATVILIAVFGMLLRFYRTLAQKLVTHAELRLTRSRVGTDPRLLRASRLLDLTRGLTRMCAASIAALALYTWTALVLQQFPGTRPWGEALGSFLLSTLVTLGWNAVTALPSLFTALVILAIARFGTRLLGLIFDGVEQGRIEFVGLTRSKAVATRRIVTTLIWLFAAILAYPYLPGSQTEAFKGISIFLGLVVSLGSSGVVNQVMSGFVLTYADALSAGDYVHVGNVEGAVTSLGILSTKVKTPRGEEVTIPNAVVIAGTTINYSRYVARGVYVPTSVTIGYDVPWRQVEALLLLAASRATGLRRDPPPVVLQTNLSDFSVEYTLQVCPHDPALRIPVLAGLRAQIQDAFNEFGVQIMSPHYESDPSSVKVVDRARWFAAPASATTGAERAFDGK